MSSSPVLKPSIKPTHDPIRLAYELREQLASSKRRTALFLGAGASMSAGLPSLDELTKLVDTNLDNKIQGIYRGFAQFVGANANLEQILNKIRTIRELTEGSSGTGYGGLDHEIACKLDSAICKVIYDKVAAPDLAKLHPHKSLATWLRHIRREAPVELFTTNYDLLLGFQCAILGKNL